jgi:hypothetical protein
LELVMRIRYNYYQKKNKNYFFLEIKSNSIKLFIFNKNLKKIN